MTRLRLYLRGYFTWLFISSYRYFEVPAHCHHLWHSTPFYILLLRQKKSREYLCLMLSEERSFLRIDICFKEWHRDTPYMMFGLRDCLKMTRVLDSWPLTDSLGILIIRVNCYLFCWMSVRWSCVWRWFFSLLMVFLISWYALITWYSQISNNQENEITNFWLMNEDLC